MYQLPLLPHLLCCCSFSYLAYPPFKVHQLSSHWLCLRCCSHPPLILSPGPSRATAGPGKPLLWGPVTTLLHMRWNQDAEGVDREGCPVTIWLGSGVQGRAPAENGFYAYLRSERSHLEHTFRYFWPMVGPQMSRDPGKLPPLSPLSTGLPVTHWSEVK